MLLQRKGHPDEHLAAKRISLQLLQTCYLLKYPIVVENDFSKAPLTLLWIRLKGKELREIENEIACQLSPEYDCMQGNLLQLCLPFPGFVVLTLW